MAQMKYFADLNGTQIEVQWPQGMKNAEYAEKFPGVKGWKMDSFARYVGTASDGSILPITRRIERKSNPSLHKCDARCLNATGRQCECACGGKNHGAGNFICVPA